MMLSLNSPTASVLVHTAWSFVVCVMGGHRSFVAFFFSTPFRTYFMPQRVCCCFWFLFCSSLKDISFISLQNHRATQFSEHLILLVLRRLYFYKPFV